MHTIPFGRPILDNAEKDAVLDVLGGPILVHGPRAKAFEEKFAAYTKAPAAVSVSSCTAAMHLLYFHLRLGPGDEVIVPAQTHAATAHAVELVGARPVFVDAERATGNVDLQALDAAITPRTRAIAVVHFLGMPVAMDTVMDIAHRHKLFVVEDCALAIGSYYKGVHAGLWGDAGCFSFYPVKHITTAEGGMIVARDTTLVSTLSRERAFGVDRTASERSVPGVYDVTMLGFNYRMSEVHAAIGIAQMDKLPEFLAARRRNFEALRAGLSTISEITLFEPGGGDFQNSYYCMSVMLDRSWAGRRFEVVDGLRRRGIGTSVYYPRPVPHMSYYRDKFGYAESTFPVARWISDCSIALPVGPHLTVESMNYIADSLKAVIGEIR